MQDVPVERYDAALCCIPDGPKIELLTYLAEHGKHALVEKPLWAADDAEIGKLEALARKNGVVLYTAYNHRFEPHYVRYARSHRQRPARASLSLPHVLRQRHGAAGARVRPGAITAPACCMTWARTSWIRRGSGSAS